jgi:phosphate uptake regulator
MRTFNRRLQVTGGSTLIVSLPKEWAEQFGLGKGDEVTMVVLPTGPVTMIPADAALNEGVLELRENATLDVAVRSLISLYLAGYSSIRIKLDGAAPGILRGIKETARRWLAGVEVVDERLDGIVLNVVQLHRDLPPRQVISRMGTIAAGMVQDSLSLLANPSRDEVQDLIDRDDEVDRFYHYMVRLTNLSIVDPRILQPLEVDEPQLLLGYTMVARSIERVADHATNVALLTLERNLDVNSFGEFYNDCFACTTYFRRSVDAVLEPDAENSQKLIDDASEYLRELERLFVKTLERKLPIGSQVALRVLYDNVKRVVEYSTDIAEVALNLSYPRPRFVRGSP